MIPWLKAVRTPIRMKIIKPNGHIYVNLKFSHIFDCAYLFCFIFFFIMLQKRKENVSVGIRATQIYSSQEARIFQE